MAWYRTGTVAVTNGSKTVTGTGTAWVNNVQPGDAFIGPDGAYYEVDQVVSNTGILLVENYGGTTGSGGAYKVIPTQGRVRDLAAQVAALILDYGSVEAALTVLSGNVGLAITPAERLHVNGNLRMPNNAAIKMDNAAGTAREVLTLGVDNNVYAGQVSAPTAAGLFLYGSQMVFTGAAERMRIDAAGNVGIGTAAPAVKLDVVGSGDGGLQYRTSTRTVGLGQASGEAAVYWGSGTNLVFFSGGIRSYIDSAGNFVMVTPSAPPSLTGTGQVVLNMTSNTNVRISARGSDGVTRVANIAVA